MKLIIDISKNDYEIIFNEVKVIKEEITRNGYANKDIVPIGWTSIADGIPYRDTYEHGLTDGYKMALQDLNIIGKENK